MKQLYIILLVLTFSNVFAQKIPWKTDLKLSPGTKYVHLVDPDNGKDETYFFDKEGRLEKDISISSLIIDYKEVYRSQFFYKDSLLIKRENFYNDMLTNITNYEYENGNLILEAEIDVKENSIQKQISYCYLDGKLSSKLVVEKNGIDITEISYTNNGSVTNLSEDNGEDDLQRLVITTEVNSVTVEEISSYNGWEDVWKEKRTFVYDNNKNLIEFSYLDNERLGTHRYSYVDNIIANAKYYDAEGLWMEEFYDKKGNIIREVRYEIGFQKAETTLFENYYNKRGNLIKVKKNGRATIKKIKIKYW